MLFVGLSVLYGITIGSSVSLDVASAHFAAWHLISTGSPWIENVGFIEGHALRDVWVTTAGGHEVIARAPGVIVAVVPAYFLAQLDGFSNVPGGLTAAVMTAGSVTLMYLVAARRWSVRASVFAALVFGLTTPVWSVAADGMWPHTLTVFAAAGMAWSAQRDRWWLVGLFAGIGIWGRVHFALVLAVLGVLEAWRQRRPMVAVKAAVPGLALLGLMSVWTRWMYGEWRLTGNYSTGEVLALRDNYSSILLNELGLFFSLGRGLLIWTPLALVLIPAVYRAWRELPGWSRSLLVGGVVYTLVQGFLNRFQGGDSFWGYRLGLELLACAFPAFVLAADRMGLVARRLLAPVVAVQFVVMLPGVVGSAGPPVAGDAWWDNPVITLPFQGSIGALVLAGILVLSASVIALVLRREIRMVG